MISYSNFIGSFRAVIHSAVRTSYHGNGIHRAATDCSIRNFRSRPEHARTPEERSANQTPGAAIRNSGDAAGTARRIGNTRGPPTAALAEGHVCRFRAQPSTGCVKRSAIRRRTPASSKRCHVAVIASSLRSKRRARGTPVRLSLAQELRLLRKPRPGNRLPRVVTEERHWSWPLP